VITHVFKERIISCIIYWFQYRAWQHWDVTAALFTHNPLKVMRVLSCVLILMVHLCTKLTAITPPSAWRGHLNYLCRKEVSNTLYKPWKVKYYLTKLPSQTTTSTEQNYLHHSYIHCHYLTLAMREYGGRNNWSPELKSCVSNSCLVFERSQSWA